MRIQHFIWGVVVMGGRWSFDLGRIIRIRNNRVARSGLNLFKIIIIM